eukprot:6474144-Amphidinium_carterae.1
MADGATASTFGERSLPDLGIQRPFKGASRELSLPGPDRIEIRGDLRISSRSPMGHELSGTGSTQIGSLA